MVRKRMESAKKIMAVFLRFLCLLFLHITKSMRLMKRPDNPINRRVPEFKNISTFGRLICPVSRMPQRSERYISPSIGRK